MSIQLGNYSGEFNVVDKSFTVKKTISNYTLLDICDLLHPVVRIDITDFDYQNCNYMYISEFNRYYYVKSVTLNNAVVNIEGDVDVLKSYANQIKSSYAIAKRCNIENRYIQDSSYIVQANRIWEYKNFPTSLNKNLQNVLIVAGGGN